TGAFTTTPSDDDLKGLRNYVESGGVLLIESAGGNPAFSDSLEKSWLPILLGDSELKPLPTNHPLLLATFPGMQDATQFSLRPRTSQKLGNTLHLKFATIGKGTLIYSPLDLS